MLSVVAVIVLSLSHELVAIYPTYSSRWPQKRGSNLDLFFLLEVKTKTRATKNEGCLRLCGRRFLGIWFSDTFGTHFTFVLLVCLLGRVGGLARRLSCSTQFLCMYVHTGIIYKVPLFCTVGGVG